MMDGGIPNRPGRYIRDKRVALGLTLRDVADHLGVRHVYYGEVERGKCLLDERYLDKLFEILTNGNRCEYEALVYYEHGRRLADQTAQVRHLEASGNGSRLSSDTRALIEVAKFTAIIAGMRAENKAHAFNGDGPVYVEYDFSAAFNSFDAAINAILEDE